MLCTKESIQVSLERCDVTAFGLFVGWELDSTFLRIGLGSAGIWFAPCALCLCLISSIMYL